MSDNTSAGTGAGGKGDRSPSDAGWYDLFSRGARDWLRHNDKVRDAVRQHLPQIVAGADVLSGGATTVRVPVRRLGPARRALAPGPAPLAERIHQAPRRAERGRRGVADLHRRGPALSPAHQ